MDRNFVDALEQRFKLVHELLDAQAECMRELAQANAETCERRSQNAIQTINEITQILAEKSDAIELRLAGIAEVVGALAEALDSLQQQAETQTQHIEAGAHTVTILLNAIMPRLHGLDGKGVQIEGLG